MNLHGFYLIVKELKKYEKVGGRQYKMVNQLLQQEVTIDTIEQAKTLLKSLKGEVNEAN